MSIQALDFRLDHSNNSGELTYRPYGVTTIRLKISSPDKVQPPLRLRVSRKTATDEADGTFRGFPNDSDALMVSWGGGHEPGPCVKPKDYLKVLEEPAELPKGEKSYIYFNLTHIKPDDLPETTELIIEAYNPNDESVASTLTITLKKPAVVPDKVRRIVKNPDKVDTWEIAAGEYLPDYDPRWFPEGVSYSPESGSLPLKIRRLDNILKLYWGDSDGAAVTLTDNTKPSILTPGDHQSQYGNTVLFELFNFDQNHIALRVWFYWLNKQIGRQQFLGRHEVPDAERFDFVMRKNDGSPIFVCTDLHWSEMWGEVPDKALEVSLGISRKALLDKVQKNVKKARDMARNGTDQKTKRVIRALKAAGSWLGWNVDAEEPAAPTEPAAGSEAASGHNPIAFIRDRTNTLYEKAIVREPRDKGSEAHLPWMHGVIEYHLSQATKRNLMVSNDVRFVLDELVET